MTSCKSQEEEDIRNIAKFNTQFLDHSRIGKHASQNSAGGEAAVLPVAGCARRVGARGGRGRGRVEGCKDGGAADAAGGGDPGGSQSVTGQLHQPRQSRWILRK